MIEWIADEKEHTCQSDFCSWVPDIVLGFPFWKACKAHDFGYSGRIPLGRNRPLSRVQADILFYRNLCKVVIASVLHGSRNLLGRSIFFRR